jgi:hypothetical protein
MNELEVIKPETVEATALETISRAEIDSQIATAKKYPRTMSAVKKSMLDFATLDVETAESCFYSLPRGGKTIQGPSVRLAEIAVSCYKNLRAGARVVQTVTDGQNPHVVVQAVCHDLENNVAITIEKRRRIVGKKKNEGRVDEDDINLATNACAAIAFRDAVYKVIPGALIKPVYEAAKKTAVGDQKTLSERRLAAFDRFAKMGVQKERVLTKLERKAIDDVTLEDLETLIGLFTAIKDGQTNIDEAFPAQAATAPKIEAGKSSLFPSKLDELKSKLNEVVTEVDVIGFMRVKALADDSLSTLAEIAELKPSAIEAVLKTWADVEKIIRKQKSTAK